MDRVVMILSEWKERILFGIVVLVCLPLLFSGVSTILGQSVVDIDAEQRQAAVTASQIEQPLAEKAIERLEHPPEASPLQIDTLKIDRPYFDDAQKYTPGRASGWSLSQETYENLPPLRLTTPGFAPMLDYDMPAGPRPALSAAEGYVPRDNRPVSLTKVETGEFDE